MTAAAISNAVIYAGDGLQRLDNADLVWEDGEITAIGQGAAQSCTGGIVDGSSYFITPGFINAHFHPTQQLNRALGVGLSHDVQMDLLHATDRVKEPEDKLWLSQVAVLEALKAGTTCFYAVGSEIDTAATVFNRLKIRAACTLIPKDIPANDKHKDIRAMTWPTEDRLRTASEAFARWHNGIVRVHFGACNVRYCSDELILGMLELAEKHDVYFHMHAAEGDEYVRAAQARTGRRPIEHLQAIGALNKRVSLAHVTKVVPEEIGGIAEAGAHVVHCPRANAYVAVGTCPVRLLREAGVNVALGSDAAINNNSNEVRGEARDVFAAYSRELGRADGISAVELFQMLTLNGAKAMGLEKSIGTLEPGKRADFVLWSRDELPFIPGHDYLADLLFNDSCQAHTVYIDGRRVLDAHTLCSADEREILQQARQISAKYYLATRGVLACLR